MKKLVAVTILVMALLPSPSNLNPVPLTNYNQAYNGAGGGGASSPPTYNPSQGAGGQGGMDPMLLAMLAMNGGGADMMPMIMMMMNQSPQP